MRATDQRVRAGSSLRRTAALVVLAFMTQACMLSTEMDLDIGNDGSGTADLLVQYDETMAGLLGGAEQLLQETGGPDVDDDDVELLTGDDLEAPYTQGLRYRTVFDDPDQLREVLLDGPFDDASVELENGVLRIDAAVEGDEFGSPDEFGFDGMVQATVVVNIDVQGEVTSANSTSTSGPVHTWEFDLARGGGDLLLTAELGGGSLLPILAALVVLLLLAGIGLAVFRAQRGGGSGPESGSGQAVSAQAVSAQAGPPQAGPPGAGISSPAPPQQSPVAPSAPVTPPPPPPPSPQPAPPGAVPPSSPPTPSDGPNRQA